MRGYLALIRGSMTMGLVYRFGFIFTIIGNALYMSVAYFLWRSIYGTRTILNGLTFNETFLYIALGSTIFILLKTYTDWLISNEIRDGSISIYLTKPLDYPTYALAMGTGFMLTNLIGVVIPTFILVVFVFKIPIVFGPGLLFVPFSLVLTFIISYFFDCITGLLTFYTEFDLGHQRYQGSHRHCFFRRACPAAIFPRGHAENLVCPAVSGDLSYSADVHHPSQPGFGHVILNAGCANFLDCSFVLLFAAGL